MLWTIKAAYLNPGNVLKIQKFRYGLHFDISDYSVLHEKFSIKRFSKLNIAFPIELNSEGTDLINRERILFGLILERKKDYTTTILLISGAKTDLTAKELLLKAREVGSEGEKLWKEFLEVNNKQKFEKERIITQKTFYSQVEKPSVNNRLVSYEYGPRTTGCWHCKKPLISSTTHHRCRSCGGLICDCGACFPDCIENKNRLI